MGKNRLTNYKFICQELAVSNFKLINEQPAIKGIGRMETGMGRYWEESLCFLHLILHVLLD